MPMTAAIDYKKIANEFPQVPEWAKVVKCPPKTAAMWATLQDP